ncbi:hypothetical protein GP486_001048 [Trichoglossum hirsutum]|uniref:Uncharacterized protein n=1 Tax=Trichoglossum hirsutum TaxID=265104 RepID=A0A9P8LHE2_9PEZI|nr:hypothetical protein GP486_001048 [Trichoglossum hirsutum]
MPKAAKPRKAKQKTTAAAAGRATATRSTRNAGAAATSTTVTNGMATAATAPGPARTPGRALRSRGACSPNMSLEALHQITRRPRKPRNAVQAPTTLEDRSEQGDSATGDSVGELQTGESGSESSSNQADGDVVNGVVTSQTSAGTDYDGETVRVHKTQKALLSQTQLQPVAATWYIDQAVQTEPPPPCTGVEDTNYSAKFSSVHVRGLILTREELEHITESRKSQQPQQVSKPASARKVTNWHSILHGPVAVDEESTASSFLRADDPIVADPCLPLHELFADAEDPKWISGDPSFFQKPLPVESSDEPPDDDMPDVGLSADETAGTTDRDAEGSNGAPGISNDGRSMESTSSTPKPVATEDNSRTPVATPRNRGWSIFSLPNSIARGLTSTVSSLLGQSRQTVDNSGPSEPSLETPTRPHGQSKSSRLSSDARRRISSERRPERSNRRLHQDFQRARRQAEVNRQRNIAPPRPSRRKAHTAPSTPAALNALGPLDTLNVPRAPETASERSRKRKYDAPPGTSYGLSDDIFHSSDSDEPVTPLRSRSLSKARGGVGNIGPEDGAERPTKKARVVSAAETGTPTSSRGMLEDTPKSKREKKIFSPPKGASYGLSEAFYEYTSSEESDGEDEEDGQDGQDGQDERSEVNEMPSIFDEQQSAGIEPPPFLIPTKAPKVSEAATGDNQVTWTKPPPPPPTPAHAELPGGRIEEPPGGRTEVSDALARARSLTEQYKPAKPSGLRRVSIISVSTASPSSLSPPGSRHKDLPDHEERAQQEDRQEDAYEGETGTEVSGDDGDIAAVAATTEAPQQELPRPAWPNNNIAAPSIDSEVVNALNRNWSKEDEDQAVKDWAAVFANIKAKHGLLT